MRVTIGRRGFVLLAILVALAVGAGIAYSAIPDSNNVYTACMLKSTGTVRLIDPSLPATNLMGHCSSIEQQLSWNQTGPQGLPGEKGAPGDKGDKGDNGDKGDPGSSGGASPIIANVTIDGVRGGDSGRDDSIEIQSYSWGVTQTPTIIGGGGGAGKANFSDFQIVKKVDAASPDLMVSAATGEHFAQVDVDLFRAGATTPYVEYELKNVMLTLVRASNGTETVEFDYTKITQRYHTTLPDGSAGPVRQGGFDLAAGRTL